MGTGLFQYCRLIYRHRQCNRSTMWFFLYSFNLSTVTRCQPFKVSIYAGLDATLAHSISTDKELTTHRTWAKVCHGWSSQSGDMAIHSSSLWWAFATPLVCLTFFTPEDHNAGVYWCNQERYDWRIDFWECRVQMKRTFRTAMWLVVPLGCFCRTYIWSMDISNP